MFPHLSLVLFIFCGLLATESKASAPKCAIVFSLSKTVSSKAKNTQKTFEATRPLYEPKLFLAKQVQRTIDLIEQGNIRNQEASDLFDKTIDIPGLRSHLLELFYSKKVVLSGELNTLLADKLIVTEVLKYFLGKKYPNFHPEGIGLKEFLLSNQLVDINGNVLRSPKRINDALDKLFPNGFLAKPLMEVASHGEIINSKKDFLAALFGGDSLYRSADLLEPNRVTHAYGGKNQLASGERYMLQGKIGKTVSENKNDAEAKINEYRVHSYGRHVIPGATEARWYIDGRAGDIAKVDGYIQNFIDLLPPGLWNRQGRSFDVFIDNQGNMNIVEINTNFGNQGAWSGFLRTPATLQAYSHFFQNQYRWDFRGLGGRLFTEGLANIKVHLKSELHEALLEYRSEVPLENIYADLVELARVSRRYLKTVPESNADYKPSREYVVLFLEAFSQIKPENTKDWDRFFKFVDSVREF